MAHERYEDFNSDDKLRSMALSREKFERDKIHRENMAKRKGLEEGREEGRVEERSIQEVLRSQELKQKDLEIAQQMLAEGLDVKMISHITGLEISEIEKLKTNNI